ncbi:unnamed protein product [Linum tenue]|uniref:C3H1-type domain-containing protein n=1 Tax=Linum tenue TaxID=586396 RepID=A0AAV0P5N3_9ROSI|nr:unnamed protein product [Linum tenue]
MKGEGDVEKQVSGGGTTETGVAAACEGGRRANSEIPTLSSIHPYFLPAAEEIPHPELKTEDEHARTGFGEAVIFCPLIRQWQIQENLNSPNKVQNDSRETATLETETDFGRDARAIRERALKKAEEDLKGNKQISSGGNEKLYKGIHGYTDHKAGFRRELTIASEKAGGSHGPFRASAHIRVSARFDYQPDICKDYKETGYCGYGDSCKFMHDRGDYKSGWQMENEWDEAEKARKKKLAMGALAKEEGEFDEANDDDDDDDEDALPFACFICREPFEDPVHHSKNKKCFVCNKQTLGIFNTAHEIRKRMAEANK